jgi:hypothetical protein
MHILGIPRQSNKAGRRKKRIQIGKEKVKLSLFADDMILYLKDLKNSTTKRLNTINRTLKLDPYLSLCTNINSP